MQRKRQAYGVIELPLKASYLLTSNEENNRDVLNSAPGFLLALCCALEAKGKGVKALLSHADLLQRRIAAGPDRAKAK